MKRTMYGYHEVRSNLEKYNCEKIKSLDWVKSILSYFIVGSTVYFTRADFLYGDFTIFPTTFICTLAWHRTKLNQVQSWEWE